MAFSPSQNRHTIILMQTTQSRASRTFLDYDSISKAIDGLCGLYERKIREIHPTIQHISYDIADLYNFIDGLADLSALVTDANVPVERYGTATSICIIGTQHYRNLLSRRDAGLSVQRPPSRNDKEEKKDQCIISGPLQFQSQYPSLHTA